MVAFGFAWVFWWLAVLEARGPVSFLIPAGFLGAFGPAVAAVAITAQEPGRAGLRSLLARALRWRVAPAWYGVALLRPPLLKLVAIALHVDLGKWPRVRPLQLLVREQRRRVAVPRRKRNCRRKHTSHPHPARLSHASPTLLLWAAIAHTPVASPVALK